MYMFSICDLNYMEPYVAAIPSGNLILLVADRTYSVTTDPTSHHHYQHPPPLMDTFDILPCIFAIESLLFMFYYMECDTQLRLRLQVCVRLLLDSLTPTGHY